VVMPDNESAWNAYVNKDLAIDVRNTKLSQNDIVLLKQYCLAGVHNSLRAPSWGAFLAGSVPGSAVGFGFVFLCAQQASLVTLVAGGVALGTGLTGIIVYAIHKKKLAECKEFHTIRYDDEELGDAESTI
jgi:hypothetical protein